MSYVEWKDEYSVGIELIDKQHRSLFQLMNELEKCHKNDEDCGEFEDIIDRLVLYVSEHFATEEAYFEESGYPMTEQHVNEHQFFIDKLNDLAGDYYSMNLKESGDMLDFLTNWYNEHILGSDRKYARHLQDYLNK